MYLEGILKVISRWVPRELNTMGAADMAIKLMTPKSLGGFGVASLQTLVSTAGVNATAEGLGMLNSIARQVPTTRASIRKVVTANVVIRDPLAILRDPLRVRTSAAVMVENGLTMAVVQWLEESGSEYSSILGLFRSENLIQHATSVAEALLANEIVNVPALERAWKATPLAFVESVVGKIKRSATIRKLLGNKRVANIRKRNRAHNLINNLVSR